MTIIVDASTAIKWVLVEDGKPEAMALFREAPLIAPGLMPIECANILSTRVRRGLISTADAQEALETILAAPVGIRAGEPLIPRAYALSVELGRSAYDCLYLALAEAEGGVMVTADLKFVRAVVAHPAYAALVRPLVAETD